MDSIFNRHIMGCKKLFKLFFWRNKHTHTHKGEKKGVLTQRHTTTPLKNHGNF